MKCSKCGSGTEKIFRANEPVFFYCRGCKLPHDEYGNQLFNSKSLTQAFNPLQHVRDALRGHNKGIAPATRTALEVALLQSVQEAYFAGIKDGVLLAYSQDKEKGEPMEKLGVSNDALIKELQQKYNDLQEAKNNTLDKTASAQIDVEIDAVKAKLDELQSN